LGTSPVDRWRIIVDYDAGHVPIQASIEAFADGDRVHFAGLLAQPFSWADEFSQRAEDMLDGQLMLW